MFGLSPISHGAFNVPSARLEKNSTAAAGAAWNSSMRRGLGGPLAIDTFKVTSAVNLGDDDAGYDDDDIVSSSAMATVGTIGDAANANSEAVAADNIPRRVVVSQRSPNSSDSLLCTA